MFSRLAFATLTAWIGLLAATSADGSSISFRLGDSEIMLPSPEGFMQARDCDPAIESLLLDIYSEGDYIPLTALITREDCATRGDSTLFSPYVIAIAYRPTVESGVSASDFSELRAYLASEQDAMYQELNSERKEIADHGSQALTKYAKTRFQLDIGEMIPLGVISSDDTHVSTLAMMRVSAEVESLNVSELQVITSTTFAIEGKLIFLYIYRKLASDTDILAAKEQTLGIVHRIAQLNQSLLK